MSNSLLFAGIFVFLGGISVLVLRVLFFRRTVLTLGKIVDIEESTSAFSKPLSTTSVRYRLVVSYVASDGVQRQVNSATTYLLKPTAGLACPVRYDPKRPDSARVATARDFWFYPIYAVVIGILLSALALHASMPAG